MKNGSKGVTIVKLLDIIHYWTHNCNYISSMSSQDSGIPRNYNGTLKREQDCKTLQYKCKV